MKKWIRESVTGQKIHFWLGRRQRGQQEQFPLQAVKPQRVLGFVPFSSQTPVSVAGITV
ncbi:hypothetical protein AmDm5_0082 [Acetobacter malorum]|nr:hypothetical protein AmDm5_0082 [Acetobacter malorum]